MSKEEMVELKIKVPARWVNFIEDYYQVTGRNRDEDLRSSVFASIEGFMLPELNAKDKIRLIEKHQLQDICKIRPVDRDEAAGITIPAKHVDPNEAIAERAASILAKKPKFNEAYDRHIKAALKEGIATLTPEERAEIRGTTS
jgi:hypothetical protein